jgi:hypothetical protein
MPNYIVRRNWMVGGSEWERAGQHLIQGDAQKVEIAADIHLSIERFMRPVCSGDMLASVPAMIPGSASLFWRRFLRHFHCALLGGYSMQTCGVGALA